MADEKILVEVFGGTNQACGCSCSDCGPGACGPSAPMNELVERLADDLKSSHGEKVEVRYIDTNEQGLANFPSIRQVIEAGYPFPITSVNGQPRFAGAINLEAVQKLLDETAN